MERLLPIHTQFLNVLMLLSIPFLPWQSPCFAAPDTCAKYRAYLESVDKRDPESVGKAVRQYRQMVVPEEQGVRDKAFVDFLIFYNLTSKEVLNVVHPKDISALKELANKSAMPEIISRDSSSFYVIKRKTAFCTYPEQFDATTYEALEERIASDHSRVMMLRRNGLILDGGGDLGWQMFNDPTFVWEIFGQHISRSLKEYVLLRRQEVYDMMYGDGELGLKADELARRVYAWEKYRHDFPNSLLIQDAEYLYQLYLITFVNYAACPNPHLETGPDGIYVKAYAQYVNEHEITPSGKIIRKWIDQLKAHDYGQVDKPWALDFLKTLCEEIRAVSKAPSGKFEVDGVYKVVLEIAGNNRQSIKSN